MMRKKIFLEKQNYKCDVKKVVFLSYDMRTDFSTRERDEFSYYMIIYFNQNGTVQEQISYDESGHILFHDFQTFYKKGSRIEFNNYDEDNRLEQTEILYFNDNGKCILKKMIEYNGNISRAIINATKHEYSAEGYVIKTVEYNSGFKSYQHHIFKHDEFGKIVCDEKYNNENKLIERKTYRYNELQQLIEMVYFRYECNDIVMKANEKYFLDYEEELSINRRTDIDILFDPNCETMGVKDFLIELKHSHELSKTLEVEDIYTYKYDEFGNCTEEKCLQYDGNLLIKKFGFKDGLLDETDELNYDTTGKLTDTLPGHPARKMTIYDSYGNYREWIVSNAEGEITEHVLLRYEYDKFGNILETGHFKNNRLLEIIDYEIHYWNDDSEIENNMMKLIDVPF